MISGPDQAVDLVLAPGEEPPIAAHLITPRGLYTHHGIYVGNGRVIHYAGLAHGLWRAPVEDVSLELFARGRAICIRNDSRIFQCGEVVERARSRLGECCYRILTNNCEHFCAWALRGESQSSQVESYLRWLQIALKLVRRGSRRILRNASRNWLVGRDSNAVGG
jgi:hypothetical protein